MADVMFGILVLVAAVAATAIVGTLGIIFGWLIAENVVKLIAYLVDNPNEQDVDKR